jgi:hypothetical protein
MNAVNGVTAGFIRRLAVAVWIDRITDEAAREALRAYASAIVEGGDTPAASIHEAILAEYRHRRDGQELCS